jgi:hypothetical protein
MASLFTECKNRSKANIKTKKEALDEKTKKEGNAFNLQRKLLFKWAWVYAKLTTPSL